MLNIPVILYFYGTEGNCSHIPPFSGKNIPVLDHPFFCVSRAVRYYELQVFGRKFRS